MKGLTAVTILQQRVEFLDGIAEVAKACNWPDLEVQELLDYLNEQLIDIDNLLYETMEETEDSGFSFMVWESRMEDLRHWLSMVLGIKIKYV